MRSQTGITNTPNVIASALFIPLKSDAIREIRCTHVIEHIKDWRTVLAEIVRVSYSSCKIEFRFPIDDGFKRDFLLSWSRADVSGMRHAYVTRKNRAHSWILDPEVVAGLLVSSGFRVASRRNPRWMFFPFWIFLPRWKRVLPSLLRDGRIAQRVQHWHVYFPKLDYEWAITAVRANS